ncbi:MAG: 1-acyl-sn-glycerol-3-phosphate acyltransferase [Acidimicrobiia bacterium]
MESPFGRRVRTIPAVVAAWLLVMALLPALLPVAVCIDAFRWLGRRTPFMATRLVLFLLAYLSIEVVGLVALCTIWFASGLGKNQDTLRRGTFAVQRRWAEAVFDSVRGVFDLTFEARGLEHVADSPVLLVARHASIIDNLLPAHYITKPHGTHIAYVMKSELLVDPCLDVAGNRLPNVFVKRGAGEAERDVAAIRTLGAELVEGQGVLIYPEGTRFTPAKLNAAVRRLEKSPRLQQIATELTVVLPPRPSGVLALLESSTADVVVMAHRGLDGFARVADIWKGAMVRTHVEIAFWRIPRSEIPEGRSERVEWLFEMWRDIDRWVRSERTGAR